MKKILLTFCVSLCGLLGLYAQPTCDRAADSLQLVALYNATDGANWSNPLGTWDLDSSMNTWYGVLLTPEGCVKYLDVMNQDADGPLPALDLPFLTFLELSGNQFSGPIPDMQLPSLLTLRSIVGGFSGQLPDFTGMPALEKMILYGNLGLQAANFSNLPNLTHLVFADCSGTILPMFDQLPSLEYVNLRDNGTAYNWPTFANSPNLSYLDLSFNDYEGAVPDYPFANQLQHLNLNSCMISGSAQIYPQYFENPNMPSLSYLGAAENEFSFDDLLSFASLDTFIYAPQDLFHTVDLIVELGDSIRLVDIDTAITNNTYIWFKDGVAIDTSHTPWLYNAQLSDSGEYHFLVTNPGLPLLTLESLPFQLSVVGPTPGPSQVSPSAPQMIAAGNTPIWVVMNADFGSIPAGMGYAYALTDSNGLVLRIFEGDSVDISSEVAGSFRVYGFGYVLPSPVETGSNLLVLSDSLSSVTRSGNYLPVEVSGASTAIEGNLQAPFSFFPNPATDLLKIEFPATASTNWEVRVLDLHGKLLWEQTQISQASLQLAVDQYPAGIYLLQVSDGQQEWTQRWLKLKP